MLRSLLKRLTVTIPIPSPRRPPEESPEVRLQRVVQQYGQEIRETIQLTQKVRLPGLCGPLQQDGQWRLGLKEFSTPLGRYVNVYWGKPFERPYWGVDTDCRSQGWPHSRPAEFVEAFLQIREDLAEIRQQCHNILAEREQTSRAATLRVLKKIDQ